MARAKKIAPSVEIGPGGGMSKLVAGEYSYFLVHGRMKAEKDRPVNVYFTDPGRARNLAQELLRWADELEG